VITCSHVGSNPGNRGALFVAAALEVEAAALEVEAAVLEVDEDVCMPSQCIDDEFVTV